MFSQSRFKTRDSRRIRKLWVILLVTFGISTLLILRHLKTEVQHSHTQTSNVLARFEQELKRSRFANFDNEKGTENGELIVPNIIHFILFEDPYITFTHFICILAALRNQRPDKIYFHTNLDKFSGQYWTRLMSYKQFTDILVIKKTEMPTEIFNQTIQPDWYVFHGGDVARMRILMKYGGIYLDSDTYIVKSLDRFRKYEMSVGYNKNATYFGNQLIVAHKDARFLMLWYYTYDGAYNTTRWYHNAGYLPVHDVLSKRPDLVHGVPVLFGHDCCLYKLYEEDWPDWRKQFAIHLFARHQHLVHNISHDITYPVDFNEKNIQKYPITFREMANEILNYEKFLGWEAYD